MPLPAVCCCLLLSVTVCYCVWHRYELQIRALRAAGVEVTMCGEHHWRCTVNTDFGRDARLLAWSGRMNSWAKVVRTILPEHEQLHPTYSVMALLVCLGAAATAYSATQVDLPSPSPLHLP